MSISQINTQLEVMRNEWLSNKDKRVQSVSESNLLLSSALSKNTSIIDKIVNSTHTNINSTNGPHIDLDIYDLVHISKIFPIRTIAKCVKFIYTYEAHCQFAEHVPAKRSYVIHLENLNMAYKNTIMHQNNHVITHIIQTATIQLQKKNPEKHTSFPKLLYLIWITM